MGGLVVPLGWLCPHKQQDLSSEREESASVMSDCVAVSLR